MIKLNNTQKTSIAVVAGIICNQDNEILISFRPKHVIQGNLWEFPGGKVEANETSYEALVRELKEEVGITVITAQPFISLQHEYAERIVLLDVWRIEAFEGTPYGREGQIIQWVAPERLALFTFPEGNKPIIEALSTLNPFNLRIQRNCG